MNHEQYLAKRKELLNEAENLINEGKFDEAEKKSEEVKALDERWDAQAKAQANLRALSSDARTVNINESGRTAETGEKVDATGEKAAMTAEEAAGAETYENAWAKLMMNKKLSAEEEKIFRMVNENYTHTTENTPVVIPTTVVAKIWTEMEGMYPYWNDVFKTYIKGKIVIIKGDSSTDAAWYEETEETEDGKEIFGKVELNGCELSRSINISWKLREMAIQDFLNYIAVKMAEKMGKGFAYGVARGAGKGEDDKQTEPLGTITALEKEEGTPQIVEYETLTYALITKARGKVKSGYRPNLYANSETIWGELANVVDASGRPLFVPDATAGGVYRVLGCVVKEDDSLLEGEILFSDAKRGYHANINKQVTVSTEEHVKKRNTDYCGYAIADGAPTTNKAHALLRKKAG